MRKIFKLIRQKIAQHSAWWGNYLTEISVLIISLALTYYCNNLIENHIKQNDDKEAMLMIRHELVSNQKELKDISKYYRKEIAFSNILVDKLNRKKRISKDSAQQYNNEHRLYYYWFLKNYAFDMIRESGTMQRMDKTLLTQLFECYEQLDVVKDMGVRYREERIKKLYEFLNQIPGGKYGKSIEEQWEQIDHCKKFKQYLMINLPMMARSGLGMSDHTISIVDQAIKKIDTLYPP